MRSTLRPIAPGTVPARSSGTVTVVQAKLASWGQGVKLRPVTGEPAEEAGRPVSSSAESSAAKTVSGARLRIGTDNSGRGGWARWGWGDAPVPCVGASGA